MLFFLSAAVLVAGVFAPLGISYVLIDRNVHLGRYYALVSGLALVLTAVQKPNGIVGRSRASRAALSARRRERAERVPANLGLSGSEGPAPLRQA